jgi:hypothetical protein
MAGRDRTGWLAQQCSWPPALPVFPANREFYRENIEFSHLGTRETGRSRPVSATSFRIPCVREQGIVFAEQGISTREQDLYRPPAHRASGRSLRVLCCEGMARIDFGSASQLDTFSCFASSGLGARPTALRVALHDPTDVLNPIKPGEKFRTKRCNHNGQTRQRNCRAQQ